MVNSKTKDIPNFEFNEENADGWYKLLPQEEKAKYQSFVARANSILAETRENGLPKQYQGIIERMAKRYNASPSGLFDEQIFAIDQNIVKTVYDQAVGTKILDTVRSALAVPKWENKIYQIDEDKIYPNLSQDFRNPSVFKIGVEPSKQVGMGLAISYEIPWTELEMAKGGLYSPDFYYAMVAAERMAILQDEMIFNGTVAAHNFQGDMGIKGLFNHGSVQSYTQSIGSTLWNVYKGGLSALSKLKTVYQSHQIHYVLTSGLASNLWYNMTTTGNIDIEWNGFKKWLLESGLIDKFWVSDRLYSAGVGNTTAIANTTQCGMAVAVGPTLQKLVDVFPLQTVPMQDKKFSGDIKEALIWGYNLIQYPVATFPVAVASGVTSTDTGILKNGQIYPDFTATEGLRAGQ